MGDEAGAGREWSSVSAGDVLPGFELPITMKTVVLALTGTRDVMPYHYDRDFCQAVGVGEVFMNTTFNQALLSRCVTDWSGPNAVLRRMVLNMTDQLRLGDVASVRGTVGRTFLDEGQPSVELALEISAGERVTSTAMVTVRLPADGVSPRTAVLDVEPPPTELSDEMPESMRNQLGRRIVRRAPYPVSAAQIGYWCDMVRDGSTRYSLPPGADDASRVIAPEASFSIWNLARSGQIGVVATAPDSGEPSLPAWPEPIDTGWPFEFRAPGGTEVIVQRRVAEFGAPIRVGDSIHSTARLVNCSGVRMTKLGRGHFVTRHEVYQNQRMEVVGSTMMSLFQYGSVGAAGGELS